MDSNLHTVNLPISATKPSIKSGKKDGRMAVGIAGSAIPGDLIERTTGQGGNPSEGSSSLMNMAAGLIIPNYILNPIVEKYFFSDPSNKRFLNFIKKIDHYSDRYDRTIGNKVTALWDKFISKISGRMQPETQKLFKSGFNEGWMYTARREYKVDRLNEKIAKLDKAFGEKIEGLTKSGKASPEKIARLESVVNNARGKLTSKIDTNLAAIQENRFLLEEAYQKAGSLATGRTSFPELLRDLHNTKKSIISNLNKFAQTTMATNPNLASRVSSIATREGLTSESLFKFIQKNPEIANNKAAMSKLTRLAKKLQKNETIVKTFEEGLVKSGTLGRYATRVGMVLKRNMTGLLGFMQGMFVASSVADIIKAKKGEKVKVAGEDLVGNWLFGFGGFFLGDWLTKAIIRVGKGETTLMNLLSKFGLTGNSTASKTLSTVIKAANGPLGKIGKFLVKIPAGHFIMPLIISMGLGTIGVKLAHKIFGKPTKPEDQVQEPPIRPDTLA